MDDDNHETVLNYKHMADIDSLCNSFNAMAVELKLGVNHCDNIFFYSHKEPIPLLHNNVEVYESPVQGRGVKANTSIPAHVVMTHYPAHAIAQKKGLLLCDHALENGEFHQRLGDYMVTHARNIHNDGETYLLIGNPEMVDNTLLLGHMVNDCSGNVFAGIPYEEVLLRPTVLKNLVASYYINGAKKRNCRYITNAQNSLVSIVSCREIVDGEELFAFYGHFYWFYYQYNNREGGIDNSLISELFKDDVFAEWVSHFL